MLMAWGEGKSAIIQETVEGEISDAVPATYSTKSPQYHLCSGYSGSRGIGQGKNTLEGRDRVPGTKIYPSKV